MRIPLLPIKRSILALLLALLLRTPMVAWGQMPSPQGHYLGFDRNQYPGDDQLKALRSSFAYTGYWLNVPPGAAQNSWSGKRALLSEHGFGFLILFNGRLEAQLHRGNAAALGRADAADAISSARREGFPANAILFLDQEEGGRLLPDQMAYVMAWVEAVRQSKYRPGVYCSGIAVPEGAASISSAKDILEHAGGRPIALWVADDACPPSPGCVVSPRVPPPEASGTPEALVWQYSQSPRRAFANQCAESYAPDGNCYAPHMQDSAASFLDLNVSQSPDPSSGRAPAP